MENCTQGCILISWGQTLLFSELWGKTQSCVLTNTTQDGWMVNKLIWMFFYYYYFILVISIFWISWYEWYLFYFYILTLIRHLFNDKKKKANNSPICTRKVFFLFLLFDAVNLNSPNSFTNFSMKRLINVELCKCKMTLHAVFFFFFSPSLSFS